MRYLKCTVTGWIQKVDRITSGPRVLMAEEKQEFHLDMQESLAWAKAELKRRRAAKNQKNSAHGIDGGIDSGHLSN